MKAIKVEFKTSSFVNCFKILPTIQITYSPYSVGFAIEFTWGKWGLGWKFYNQK